MTALLVVLLTTTALFDPGPAQAKEQPCDRFEGFFRKAAGTYLKHLPSIPWQYLAAQAQAESNCNPDARSPVGAMGLAQFMPATFEEWCEKVPQLCRGTANDPEIATLAQAYYMAWIHEFCAKRIDGTALQLRRATTGSYNAGIGSICVNAYRAAGSADWNAIIAARRKASQTHWKETDTYVKRIERFFPNYLNRQGRIHHAALHHANDQPAVVRASTPATQPQQQPKPDPAPQPEPIREEAVMDSVEKVGIELVAQASPASFLVKSILLNYQFAFGPALLGIIVLILAYKLLDRMLPKLKFHEEIHEGNTPLAYIICTYLLVIGAILCVSINAGIKGG